MVQSSETTFSMPAFSVTLKTSWHDSSLLALNQGVQDQSLELHTHLGLNKQSGDGCPELENPCQTVVTLCSLAQFLARYTERHTNILSATSNHTPHVSCTPPSHPLLGVPEPPSGAPWSQTGPSVSHSYKPASAQTNWLHLFSLHW